MTQLSRDAALAAPVGRRRDLTLVVALAAALWGTDALLRLRLAAEYQAATIVALEHVIIVAVTLPWLAPALRAFLGVSRRTQLAVAVIGIGASAVATILFTQAFRTGDFITPVMLQKLQPIFAVLAATWLLGERLRPRFALFVGPALVGAWLVAFADPFAVSVDSAKAAALAAGAAVLWGSGTVLGRLASAELSFRDLTVLRFAWGMPAAVLLAVVLGAPLTVDSASDASVLVGLALVPGLAAIILYYVGLRRTPASRATLAELAYPVSGAVIGVFVLSQGLSATQWLGIAIVVVAVTLLAWHERVSRTPAVKAADDVHDAVLVT